ncbi:hypothetical protein AVEN_132154-1 [Araneus ventricosus]|uniref:Uncharacterized protein n=1 Tax=Araneus ventricosus TaxID=182803 RepID=A0A4Y2HD71_ARAVE|nr:hypothetical protein AVEN_61918-1 [Araneus ventricosus]GBM63254.1 hypothetical protein AVEN_132154-1 [Araneus ventricosus]
MFCSSNRYYIRGVEEEEMFGKYTEKFNSISPIPPQTAPFDRGRTQAVSGARVNFTGEKWFLSLLTIDRPNLGVVSPRISVKKGFHSGFVKEHLLQFLRYWNSYSSRAQRVKKDVKILVIFFEENQCFSKAIELER